MIEAVDAAGFHMNVYVDDQPLRRGAERGGGDVRRRHARLEAHAVGDLLAWLDRPTTKIVVVGEPEGLDRLQDELRARFDGRAFIAKSLPIFLELALPGREQGRLRSSSCATGSASTRPTVVAFGDGANDVELLETAGPGRGGRRRRRRTPPDRGLDGAERRR